ncbi:MAG: hypothetical protein J6V44_03685 [Methanobrevibacter sp.]|nr:hypothetical protein [Methanobrevibacter sp.]
MKKLKEKLLKEYPKEKIDELFKLFDELEKEKKIKTITEKLEKAQEIVNELYETKYNSDLLEAQIIINGYRNEYDITDPREIINYDNGKGFVQ